MVDAYPTGCVLEKPATFRLYPAVCFNEVSKCASLPNHFDSRNEGFRCDNGSYAWWFLCLVVLMLGGFYAWWFLCLVVLMLGGSYAWWFLCWWFLCLVVPFSKKEQ